MPTFLPYAYRTVFAGIIDTVINWAILSALLSMAAIVVAFIADPSCGTSGTCDIFTITPDPLKNLPAYSFFPYYQILWVILLVVIIIGGLIYAVTLSQAEDMEFPVDYFQVVAKRAVLYTGAALMVWLIGPVAYLIFTGDYYLPSDILSAGMEGLQRLGMTAPITARDYIFNYIHPYWPGVVYAVVIVYTLRNAHTGWAGNKWVETG